MLTFPSAYLLPLPHVIIVATKMVKVHQVHVQHVLKLLLMSALLTSANDRVRPRLSRCTGSCSVDTYRVKSEPLALISCKKGDISLSHRSPVGSRTHPMLQMVPKSWGPIELPLEMWHVIENMRSYLSKGTNSRQHPKGHTELKMVNQLKLTTKISIFLKNNRNATYTSLLTDSTHWSFCPSC